VSELSTTDRELVGLVSAHGDEDAFRRLYRAHTPALYATALRLSPGAAEAADAVHDAWVRAVERLGEFQWKSSLRTWLTGILVNVVRESRRAHWREEPYGPDDVAAEPPDLLLSIDLDAAIARLAPGYREVFVLHDMDGFTHDEIARLLGVEPGTSKSQLSRARGHLRRMLGEPAREPRS
jgi:RNA polymerase sigma-70 factor (ECF subfamily)